MSETNNGTSMDILDEVRDVLRERNGTHGDARQQFRIAASMKEAYLDGRTVLCAHDNAIFGLVEKLSRIAVGEFNRDHYVDILGYAVKAYELALYDNNREYVSDDEIPF